MASLQSEVIAVSDLDAPSESAEAEPGGVLPVGEPKAAAVMPVAEHAAVAAALSVASAPKSPSAAAEMPGTSRTATLRLMADLRAVSEDPPDGVSAALVDDADLYEWRASLSGPEGTPWEGGIYALRIKFDGSYPDRPPKIRFTCDMFHPNIYSDGGICMDTMKNMWKPIYTAGMILQSVQSLLSDPNPDSAANPEAAKLLTADPRAYRRRIRVCAEKSIEMGFDD